MSLESQIEELKRALEDVDLRCAAKGGVSFWSLIESLPNASDSLSTTRDDPFSVSLSGASGLLSGASGLLSGASGERKSESRAHSLRILLQQLASLNRADQCPIIAITGLLNAGKSSLLAGFLSASGRARVLIGQANDQGTHRFILWVPENWRRDPQVWQLVLEQLTQVFGSPPELLSEDREKAKQQYNGEILDAQPARAVASETTPILDALTVPLIATDSALDRWGIALMDCPDVQTGLWRSNQETDESSSRGARTTIAEQSMDRAEHRAKILVQAMRLCSAFLCVAPANSLHDQLVLDILAAMQDKMPGVERIMVINRVPRRYACSEIYDEVKQSLGAFGLSRVYMAYHFEGPLQRERLPPAPENSLVDPNHPLPVFIRIDTPTLPQPPAPFDPQLYLHLIGSQIDRGKLMGDCKKTLAGQIGRELQSAWREIREDAIARQKRLKRVWQTVAEACSEFSRGDLSNPEESFRLHASREIVVQLSESLERTAPWWAKPSRYVVRAARVTKETVSNTTKNVLPLNWLSSKGQGVVDFVQGKFRRGEIGKVVNASRLVQQLLQFDYLSDLKQSNIPAPALESRCQTIIDRFQEESRTRLDDALLDRYTAQVWAQMGWKQRVWTGLIPATMAVAPLLAVIALPFDFGGSSVLVLASMKELLFAGAAGTVLALANQDGMPKVAEQEAAWQQLSDLFAIGCDQLGLPRPSDSPPELLVAHQRKKLMPGSVPSTTASTSVIPLPIQINQDFWPRLESILKRLNEESGQ